MCEVCEDLESKVKQAAADGDATKARVMNALLVGHRKHQHGKQVETVTVMPDGVIWPGGKVWVVGRDNALDKT